MTKPLTCFKSYDIRGRVPEELDESLAYLIGRAYAQEINPGAVVVGYDVRLESLGLAKAVTRGLADEGVSVIDIGLCGTEEVYFHTFNRAGEGVGGGIMITASHNPKGYNGMKMVRAHSKPIFSEAGLYAIRDRVGGMLQEQALMDDPSRPSTALQDHDKTAYIRHLLTYIQPEKLQPLKIVVNAGNGPASLAIRALEKFLPFEFIYVQEEPNGHFPNGVPNPILVENRSVTRDAVLAHGADLGVAWDGDFDRCFFFDEQGCFIEGYYIVGLLAEAFLTNNPGQTVVHDPRLIWNTIDIAKAHQGRAVQTRTGHAFMKDRMRTENAIYGGEMSAHHYFRDFAYCDSGMIPWLVVAQLMSISGQSLSSMVSARIKRYPCSGEINYQVRDTQKTIEIIKNHYEPFGPDIDQTDGLSFLFDDWRFNVRASNTEPLLRLNVETKGDVDLLETHVQQLNKLVLSLGN